jgi:hypothetical protein
MNEDCLRLYGKIFSEDNDPTPVSRHYRDRHSKEYKVDKLRHVVPKTENMPLFFASLSQKDRDEYIKNE